MESPPTSRCARFAFQEGISHLGKAIDLADGASEGALDTAAGTAPIDAQTAELQSAVISRRHRLQERLRKGNDLLAMVLKRRWPPSPVPSPAKARSFSSYALDWAMLQFVSRQFLESMVGYSRRDRMRQRAGATVPGCFQ
jgi:hypothetical protein